MKKMIALVFAMVLVIACISSAFAVIPTCKVTSKDVYVTRGGSRLHVYAETSHANGYRATITGNAKITYVCGRSVCGHDLPFSSYQKTGSQSNTSSKGCRAYVKFNVDCPHVDDSIQNHSESFTCRYLPKD